MTREETKSCIGTIKMLQRLAYNIHGVMDVIDADNCKKIIKALEQEPCEDCISRQAVLNILDDMVKDYIKENDFDKAQGVAWVKVQKLPPVTPQPKTGHWIGDGNYICSCCKCNPLDVFLEPLGLDGGSYMSVPMKYCPNCGAKMEGDKR